MPGQTADGSPIIYNYNGDALLRSGSTSVQGPHGWEIRNGWHAYHQYVLEKGFQVYHRFDYRIQKNFYQDDQLAINQSYTLPDSTVRQFYHTNALGDTSRLEQLSRFRLLENQFGIKGIAQYKAASFNYRAYLRIRNYKQHTRYNTSATNYNEYDIPRTETFVGGWFGYYFPDSLSQVTAELEYQVGGGYRLQGQFDSKYLTVGYSSMFVNPTLLQERFQSMIQIWRNNFSLRGFNHAFAKLNLRYKQLRLEPNLDYYLLSNYVYYDTAAIARQASGSFSVLRTGLGYHLPFGKFLLAGQALYTVQSRSDILRTPPFFLNARLQYEFLYAKVLYIQAGIDIHYKSPYYADAYMPLTQQFYLQNRQKVEGYVLADLYANLRVNRTRLFVKLTHANQGLFAPGYFVAPDFLQVRRGFAFGVDWYLFD
ncbi:putative porin [Spirosoma sp. KNUC1025]|uniref:putative porin n=1 Tax=Spirosoma sp. KNUC1025 TaxID=2894082 RepID=UPI00386CB1D8